MAGIEFIPIEDSHLQDIADILNYYILNSTATFHKEILSADEMREKVFFVNPIYKAFLIKYFGEVVGYCAVSMWKKQEAYRHTAEINIYLKNGFTGRGIGNTAITYLEQYAKEQNIYNLIAGLCRENIASNSLFEKNGYILCAHFKGVGEKFGRVLDTVYFQKRLD